MRTSMVASISRWNSVMPAMLVAHMESGCRSRTACTSSETRLTSVSHSLRPCTVLVTENAAERVLAAEWCRHALLLCPERVQCMCVRSVSSYSAHDDAMPAFKLMASGRTGLKPKNATTDRAASPISRIARRVKRKIVDGAASGGSAAPCMAPLQRRRISASYSSILLDSKGSPPRGGGFQLTGCASLSDAQGGGRQGAFDHFFLKENFLKGCACVVPERKKIQADEDERKKENRPTGRCVS